MRTDGLIEMLVTDVAPARPLRPVLRLALAFAIGLLGAICVMLAVLGARPDLAEPAAWRFTAAKLSFALSIAGFASGALILAMRPGRDVRKILPLAALPFVGMGFVVGLGHDQTWSRSLLGMHWAMCLACIPLFAILPFAALTWTIKQGAPTSLRLTGAAMGLAAGALGAAAYAFYCPDDTLPLIGIWYGMAILLCALFGALIGPRLLRW